MVAKNSIAQSKLEVVGDVQIVLKGCVDHDCIKPKIHEQVQYGLGAGSFSDIMCLGEAIVLNHFGCVSHVTPQNEVITIANENDFQTPFLIGLKNSSPPSHTQESHFTEPRELEKFFDVVGQQLDAFAVMGYVNFDNLSCSYLKTPPIYREDITQNTTKYWAETENRRNCWAYIFGVVVRTEAQHKFDQDALKKAFYINPFEVNKLEMLSHTHAALVDKPDDNIFQDDFIPRSIQGVRHIFTHSLVKSYKVQVYTIKI